MKSGPVRLTLINKTILFSFDNNAVAMFASSGAPSLPRRVGKIRGIRHAMTHKHDVILNIWYMLF